MAVDEPLGQPTLGESGRAPSEGRGLEVTLAKACGECAAAHREGRACPRLLPLPLSVVPVDGVDAATGGAVLANPARRTYRKVSGTFLVNPLPFCANAVSMQPRRRRRGAANFFAPHKGVAPLPDLRTARRGSFLPVECTPDWRGGVKE